MQAVRTPQQEAAEDIFFGQVVIIWARWFLILAGTILIFWSASTSEQLVSFSLPIVALMAMNFYLHGRYLIEKPANRLMLMATSLIDMVVITAIVLLWEPRGLLNQFYIFYFPMILAVSFVFPRRDAILYTAFIAVVYSVAMWSTSAEMLATTGYQKVMIVRLITMAALCGVGTYYWKIQRSRRREIDAHTV